MPSVLIVDDSTYSRRRLRDALREEPCSIEEAASGASALAKLEKGLYSCILTDLIMPEMDGFALLAEIRRRSAEIPVFVLTADVQKSTRTLCEELGATAVFTKPYDLRELRSAVVRTFGEEFEAR